MIDDSQDMIVTMRKGDLSKLVAEEVERVVIPLLNEILGIVRSGSDPDNDIADGADEISRRLHVSTATLTKMMRDGCLEGIVMTHCNRYVASKRRLAEWCKENNNPKKSQYAHHD